MVVKKWRNSQLYLEKFKISTLVNKCPGFPGNSWQKELAQKKGLRSKEHKFAVYPPFATNMEVNLRIVTLVKVEEKKHIFFCTTVKGGGVLHCTSHFTLHTPHSTLHTLHSALHTSHFSSNFKLHTSHRTLHTTHFTLHFTSRSTLHASRFTLHTPHFTLHTPHFQLPTSHSTLHTPHLTLHTPHVTLHNAHFHRSQHITFSHFPHRQGRRRHQRPTNQLCP